MGGMRKAPPGVHRERSGDERPAVWYVVWLGLPHAEGSVVLGRTKRLERHLWHRAFPERAGLRSQDIKGHNEAMTWLLEVHGGAAAD